MIPGIYKARPTEAILCCTEKNVEYVGVTFEITEGEYIGSAITRQFFWTPKSEDYTRADLKRLGWTGNTKNVDGQAHLVLPSDAVPICIKEELYNGKTSLKVDWVVSPPAGVRESDKLNGRAAAELLARIKGQSPPNGVRNMSNRQARDEYGPGAGDGGNSDVPF